jgi:hypothetical protein
MFKRYASATVIEKISIAQAKKIVHAEDESPMSFEYDPENFTYFRCRAITANEANGNGDLFPDEHLRKSFKTFVGVGLYKDHDSDSIDKAIGKVLWAEYIVPNEGNPYVETICAVDKQLAPDLARRVESGIATSVSMGCSVREAECGVGGCGNIARNPQELCQHMMPGFGVKGRRNPDGSTIYEINRGIQFTELSLVTVPADPTARIFEVYAKLEERKASMSRADFVQELVRIAESATAEQMSGLREYLDKNGLTYEKTLGAEASFGDNSQKRVERKDKLVEHTMGLSISYLKGASLASSFFVARDASASYRVAAADVLPIVVQKSIQAGDAGVVTPEGLISDLTQKYASVGDFKAWAKRRRKKNRDAMKKCSDAPATGVDSVETAKPACTEEAGKPRVDELSKEVKASDSNNGRSEMDKKVPVALEKKADAAPVAAPAAAVAEVVLEPVVEVAAQPEAEKPLDEKGEIFAAFEALRKYVESKLADGTKREAVKTEMNVGKTVSDGEHGDKSVNVSAKGVEEPKTESPKGHMDKGAALKVEAMDKDWSINPKELEKPAKVAKSTDNMPHVMSVDRKELSSEAVDANTGGNAGGLVKKYYNRLPSNGPGEAPKALDAKSAQDPEKEMLRKALAEEKAKVAQGEEKERLQAVADKVYEVVTAMKEKNLLADGKEDAVIDTLTARFADIGQLENLKTLFAHLSIRKATAEIGAPSENEELPVGSIVPQVFETVENTEDAVLKMASIWNR